VSFGGKKLGDGQEKGKKKATDGRHTEKTLTYLTVLVSRVGECLGETIFGRVAWLRKLRSVRAGFTLHERFGESFETHQSLEQSFGQIW
jgi:hypothetical protein